MSHPNAPFLSVVIPAYNEAGRIGKTLRYIHAYLEKQTYSYEIIVVDAASADDTEGVVHSLHLSNTNVKKLAERKGKGWAVHQGVMEASGQYIIMCDADNATPFEEVEKLLSFTDQYPIVIGSRYLKESHIGTKQPIVRILGSRLVNTAIQLLLLPGIPDTQCGFKLFAGDVAKRIFAKQTIWEWAFDIEILYIAKRFKLGVKQVPIEWHDQAGSHLQSSQVLYSTMRDVAKIRRQALSGHYTP